MKISCIQCKGRNPKNCGRTFCPIIAKSESLFKIKEKSQKSEFVSSSPAPFIGHYGYPFINVGVLSPIEETSSERSWIYDAPRHWSENDFQIRQIIDFRSSLVNSRFKNHITSVRKSEKFLDISKEIGMASKPVDIEVKLKDKPKFRLNTDAHAAPTGPAGELQNLETTSNPKIDSKVDKVVSDVHFKANDAMKYLYKKGFDENFLSKLLSVGSIGMKKDRRLVPTRWAITAADDSIAKTLMDKIKDCNETDYAAYFGGYLGNYYLILMFPDVWSYELFEMYMPKASWNTAETIEYTTDHEFHNGRKDYAENTAGGYYATKLALLEHLSSKKRKGTCLVLRFITGEYSVPLGVWVVREATRKSLASQPLIFSDKELMLKYAEKLVKKKFGYDITHVLKNSLILKNMRTQRKLVSYI
ncbi:MAG: hypothetical protein Q8O89_01965 [Nanoarchaeota archaeon]|nr:hypothetical protein [Nanoarchaeota archaeon]